MSGENPGKRHGALLVSGCLGAAFVFTAVFFIVTDQLAAEQKGQNAAGTPAVSDVGPVGAVTPAFTLRIRKEPHRIKLKGTMPSEEHHKTLLGLVKANFASIDISDRVKAAEGAVSSNVKVGGVNFALKVLSCLETGSAIVDNGSVTLDGVAATSTAYEEARKYADSGKPTGIEVKKLDIAPPPAELKWSAVYSGGHLSVTGVVAGEGEKKVLETTARELFGQEIKVSTGVAESAPENWMAAALHSLQLLRNLEWGSVKMTGQSIRVVGTAADEATLETVDALAVQYPRGFALESKVSAAKRDSAPTGEQAPEE
jgi:hypothetical protein